MKPVNFEFEYENFTYEVTHNGYDLDGFVLKYDGYVQCVDTPDENKCDLSPVYVEYNHKEGVAETIVVAEEDLVLNATEPAFKLKPFGELWDNLIGKLEFPPQTP